MTPPHTRITGSLAKHRRGRVIQQAAGAEPVEGLPADRGLCIAAGSDYQDSPVDRQSQWLEWAAVPARTLLLIPPFRLGESESPVQWRIYRPESVATDERGSLPRLLVPEVRHAVAGRLQVPRELGATWTDGAVNTGFYRKHPYSGLFAVTCLPLWSLLVLDHGNVLADWLQALHSLAGEPSGGPQEGAEPAGFQPTPNHYAMMLHLCAGRFSDREETLRTLEESPVLAIPGGAAAVYLDELREQGLVVDGQLSDRGRSLLRDSQYAVYAEAMEASQE